MTDRRNETTVLVDNRGGRPRVYGWVLKTWYEIDEDAGVSEEYAEVLTTDGTIDRRAWIGGPFMLQTL
jgi:hypothetical protein